ncbi:MAG: nickel pincer cofactor biosynthesis protein LarB [Actinomycetota bacterium]|nr:nickel pincer cofactor biosynthesis protein LarB [Actinomycetota bacterium]
MDETGLRALIDEVRAGLLTPDDAVARLRRLPYANLGFARVDHHRALRQGMAEAVFAPGKTEAQCAAIVVELLSAPGGPVILTRASASQVATSLTAAPGGTVAGSTVVWRPAPERPERIVVLTAGTADQAVAEECAATLGGHGLRAIRLDDVGVAGLHRLLDQVDAVAEADAVVVIAGMEGALASVVGGLAPGPVVAVPTSAGYGAALGGVTALLGMLATCAAGVTVVGIDNGFGAACAIVRMVQSRQRRQERHG